MITFSNSIFEFIWNLGFNLELSTDESIYIVQHLERNIKGVDRIGSIKQIEPILLFHTSKNKLFLIRITIEEFLTQKSVVNLATLAHVVKNIADKTP